LQSQESAESIVSRPFLKEPVGTEAWIGGFRPNAKAKLTLFCFPYAGGTSHIYRNWSTQIPSLIDICPVHLPGRARRLNEDPFRSVIPLAEAAAEALLPYTDKPYAFFGHSMGALISFQLARRYRQQNRPLPVHLFVSGSRAPQLPDPDPPTYNLSDAEFVAELRRLNGTPPDVLEHAELLELMLPLLRADFELCQTYAYEEAPPLNCPITAFGGLQDVDISRAQVEGWGAQTTGPFLARMLPGDHFFLHAQEPIILEMVSRELYRIATTGK